MQFIIVSVSAFLFTTPYAQQADRYVPKTEIDTFVAKLSNPDGKVVQAGIDAIVGIGETAIPSLLTSLNEKDEKVRCNVLLVFGEMRRVAINKKQVVTIEKLEQLLLNALLDPSDQMVSYGVYALTKDGLNPNSVIPALTGILEDKRSREQSKMSAIRGITRFGTTGSVASPSLMVLIRDKKTSSNLRMAAIVAVSVTKLNSVDILQELQEIALDTSESLAVRGCAVKALGEAGAKDRATQRTLRRILDVTKPEAQRDKAWTLRMHAIRSLSFVSPDEKTAQSLRSIIQGECEEESVKEEAIHAVARIGPRARIAVPALIDVLVEERYSAPKVAIVLQALQRIGTSAKEAVPVLRDLVGIKELKSIRSDMEQTIKILSP
jgi:HEAT repeat protein